MCLPAFINAFFKAPGFCWLSSNLDHLRHESNLTMSERDNNLQRLYDMLNAYRMHPRGLERSHLATMHLGFFKPAFEGSSLEDRLSGMVDWALSPIIFFSPTKFAFSPTLLLFRQVGSLFRQVGSLFRQSLRSQVSGSPLESRPSDGTASFCLRNLKLLSLSAQLERNAWQKLAAVSSGGTSLVTAPFSSY